MRFDVKHANGHYELYVNNVFHSSHDTPLEAAKEIELIIAGED